METIEIPYTIKLQKPVLHGDKEVTELVIPRELCAGDLRGIPINGMCYEHVGLVISRLTGYPPSVIDKLSGPDFNTAGEVVSSFL